MPTNIDTGLTVQDAVNADHSPHVFTMSNGDLLAIYYDGTNLVWRSKSGGSWSASTTITLDTGVTPPSVSYWTRHGDVILGAASIDPIDLTHSGDFFELTYVPSTHTLGQTNKQVDTIDGHTKIDGVAYTSGATANDQVLIFRATTVSINFAAIQEVNVNPTISGVDQTPTYTAVNSSSSRTGVVSDGTTTTYLMYGVNTTGTAFVVERFTAGSATDTVETPPAPAANPAGVTAVYDGTNYVFLINENNAKLRYLIRTGTNTYGSWTDILSDASLVGQPVVCVKANGDLALFYRTNKNQANGEIWVVQRTSGTWGSPALLAGGAATGWSNPSVAAGDLNDAGVARVVYVTGTASTWTLVEDSYTFTAAGGGGATVPSGPRAHGQWPNAPLRTLTRASLWPKEHNVAGVNLTDAAYGLNVEFYGEPAPRVIFTAHGQWPMAPVRTITRSALWTKAPGYNAKTAGINENDETRGVVDQFYGILDTYGVQQAPQIAIQGNTAVSESAQLVEPLALLQAQSALLETAAQVVEPAAPLIAGSSLLENTAQVVAPATIQAQSALVETSAIVQDASIPVVASSLMPSSAQLVDPSAPVVANALLTESAQLVEPVAVVAASSVLSVPSAQVVDPSIPVVANSVLNATGGLAGNFVNGSVTFVANTLLAETAQVVDPAIPVVASSVLVESSAQLVDPSIPMVASSLIAENVQVVAHGDALIASSALAASGTILGQQISGDVSVATVALMTVALADTPVMTVRVADVGVDVDTVAIVALATVTIGDMALDVVSLADLAA